ncbi:hypothetical protein [Phenylobacterium sp.]|uniref:hypothetical protein n=1 Tax=Phenylobacterium sp. TaxID=1871053 RepID=UPI00272FCBAC|nr:hypothetical protein [Phenylobacterium sp.]MDP2212422.1 hypothetical protein [Phenylobacterium sp.]
MSPQKSKTAQITESPRTRQILDERERRLARPEADGPSEAFGDSLAVLLCPFGENLYGLPMSDVASLRPLEQMSRTGAGQAGGVVGLVADSGRVRQVLDFGVLLGAPPPQSTAGYLVMLKGRSDLALRLGERPYAADVSAESASLDRAQVVSPGPHHAKTLVILSVAALLASDAPVGV